MENGTRIRLTYIQMDLEESEICSFDYIEIRESTSTNVREKNLIARYCGKTLPPTWTSTTNEVMVKFHSDPHGTGKGFRIHYQMVCGEILTAPQGVIRPPEYQEDTLNVQRCEWVIVSPPSTAITLNFVEFHLGDDLNGTCSDEYLEVSHT